MSDDLKNKMTGPSNTSERISKADVEDAGLELQLQNKGKKAPKSIVVNTVQGTQIKVTARQNKFKKSIGETIFFIFDYLFFILFTIACIFPFYYMIINTISGADYVNSGAVNLVPKGLTFSNYSTVMGQNDLGNAVVVTIIRTILGTGLMVAASAFVGYLVTKQEMWGRKFFYRFLVITMYFNAGLIPWYMNMQMLGLTNNFLGYIIPGVVAPYNIILVKTYIESIPAELEESAFMDGASYLKVFTSIVWPLSKPILATIAIFGAVGNWNSFQDSLILMGNSPKIYTLQHRLYIYLTMTTDIKPDAVGSATMAVDMKVIKYTVSMVSIIPILLVYPFMQRYFEEGIMLGAVKG